MPSAAEAPTCGRRFPRAGISCNALRRPFAACLQGPVQLLTRWTTVRRPCFSSVRVARSTAACQASVVHVLRCTCKTGIPIPRLLRIRTAMAMRALLGHEAGRGALRRVCSRPIGSLFARQEAPRVFPSTRTRTWMARPRPSPFRTAFSIPHVRLAVAPIALPCIRRPPSSNGNATRLTPQDPRNTRTVSKPRPKRSLFRRGGRTECRLDARAATRMPLVN
mmetsp:Transcript_172/g.1290  ORF Transcript_172/g.1290 Transcript_172/m.1290 type:complete len:221 (-) Transcript_172:106-768(-)